MGNNGPSFHMHPLSANQTNQDISPLIARDSVYPISGSLGSGSLGLCSEMPLTFSFLLVEIFFSPQGQYQPSKIEAQDLELVVPLLCPQSIPVLSLTLFHTPARSSQFVLVCASQQAPRDEGARVSHSHSLHALSRGSDSPGCPGREHPAPWQM